MTDTKPVAHQPRVPEGVTSGGEWITPHLEEPAPMKLYDRGTGTCFNPPMATTAEKALEFWQKVEIPDITIQNARNLYANAQHQDFSNHVNALVQQHEAEWIRTNPRPKLTASRAVQWEQDRAAEIRRVTAEIAQAERGKFFHADNPEYIGPVDAQQVVRAWFTRRNCPNPEIFPGESEKLDAHEVELYRGSETIGTLYKRYRLSRFADELETVPDPAGDAIHVMQGVLADILFKMSGDMERTADAVQQETL